MTTTTTRRSVRRERRQQRRDWRRSRPGILPRTFSGVAIVALAVGVTLGVSGAAFAAWSTLRLNTIETELTQRIDALSAVQADTEANPTAGADTSRAIWAVRSTSELGNPTAAAGYVVTLDGGRAHILTVLDPVRRSTYDDANVITVEANGVELPAQLWSWDNDAGLAILTVDTTATAALPWATTPARVGDPVTLPGVPAPLNVTAATAQRVTATAAAGVDVSGVAPGNPLLDTTSHVVGTVTAVNPTERTVTIEPNQQACESLVTCTA